MRPLVKALQNIRRTPYQAIAAISVLTVTFFVTYLIGFITLSLSQSLKYFESRPQILVFFDTATEEDVIVSLKQKLESNPEVLSVSYVPQEEALQIYRELNKNDPLLLELVTADILPASLEVSGVTLESLEGLKIIAEQAEGVDEVILRSDVVDTLERWLTGVKVAGTAFISIMVITSLLILIVVVGMKVSGRNFEIRIMRLIGAGSWYIQVPYLIEGAFYGVVAANLAFALSLSVVLYASPLILEFAGEVPLLPDSVSYILIMYGAATAAGFILGIFGSFIAVKRFLRL